MLKYNTTIKSNKNSQYKPSCNSILELYDKRETQNYLVVKKLSILIILYKTLNKEVLINAQIITKIVIKKIILNTAINRKHISRKFQISNRHDESTNNVTLRFDFAHRITRWSGDMLDKSKHV